ncbi:hypothetical protein D9613_012928 [Agrocybe pediades]|uniref:Uncharacterized protein n=1 Tax=Agrocybe pediades TaxID=84607 RepID=A0A8H4QEX7_9AGAR|nr:hypothetical protein D9613_012928 [Agrocybe pediades]
MSSIPRLESDRSRDRPIWTKFNQPAGLAFFPTTTTIVPPSHPIATSAPTSTTSTFTAAKTTDGCTDERQRQPAPVAIATTTIWPPPPWTVANATAAAHHRIAQVPARSLPTAPASTTLSGCRQRKGTRTRQGERREASNEEGKRRARVRCEGTRADEAGRTASKTRVGEKWVDEGGRGERGAGVEVAKVDGGGRGEGGQVEQDECGRGKECAYTSTSALVLLVSLFVSFYCYHEGGEDSPFF